MNKSPGTDQNSNDMVIEQVSPTPTNQSNNNIPSSVPKPQNTNPQNVASIPLPSLGSPKIPQESKKNNDMDTSPDFSPSKESDLLKAFKKITISKKNTEKDKKQKSPVHKKSKNVKHERPKSKNSKHERSKRRDAMKF